MELFIYRVGQTNCPRLRDSPPGPEAESRNLGHTYLANSVEPNRGKWGILTPYPEAEWIFSPREHHAPEAHRAQLKGQGTVVYEVVIGI